VSQSYGAGDRRECARWLRHGVALAAVAAPAVMAVTGLAYLSLDRWGLHPEIQGLVSRYVRVVAFGALPLLMYAAFRRYLQGMHIVRPIMLALVSANGVNAAGDWVLIYGHRGVPPLGVEGAAWATTLARVYMAVFLYAAIRHEHRRQPHHAGPRRLELARMRRLVALGLPAATQTTVEVGVFAAATALAGRLDPVSSASHQIALNLASFAFMVPLGLASSGAV